MVRAGALPSAVLGQVFWDQSLLVAGDHEGVLRTLIELAARGDTGSLSEAVSMVRNWLKDEPTLVDSSAMLDLMWTTMELSLKYRVERAWEWIEALRILAQREPERAIKIAIAAMLDGEPSGDREAESLLTELAPEHPELVMEELGNAMMSERGWVFSVSKHSSLISALPIELVKGWLGRTGIEAARRVARHLPEPFLGGNDGTTPEVPELTTFVLTQYENDDRTFEEFVSGFHSMQWYTGDIAAQHLREAEHARKFASHRLRRIREWARIEEEHGLAAARRWTREVDEDGIE